MTIPNWKTQPYNIVQSWLFNNPQRVIEYQVRDENGNLQTDIDYTMGSYNGSHKSYYENGKLKKEMNYFYDELHGSYKTYYENGNLKEETTYVDGVKTGTSKKYNEDGSLAKEIEYFKDYVYKM